MAGNYLGAWCAQYAYVNAELGARALFYLLLMANPDTVEPKYSSQLSKSTTSPIMQLAEIYTAKTLREF